MKLIENEIQENGNTKTKKIKVSLTDKKDKRAAKPKKLVGDTNALKKKKTKQNGHADDKVDTCEAIDSSMSLEQQEGQFTNFPITDETITKLVAKGIKYLFPIQAKTFDLVHAGKDVIAKARTGTGKTLAFSLPLVEKLQNGGLSQHRGRPPSVLILTPTRELANQVAADVKSISKLQVDVFYGGVEFGKQGQAIRNGLDVLVGTPGRVLDWVNKGALDTSKLKHVILDEVDQMLDMGFAQDVDSIISCSYNFDDSSKNPQTLLFSATLPTWVHQTAKKYMKPDVVEVDLVGSQTNQTATNVKHYAISINWPTRAQAIGRIVQCYSGNYGRAMVFTETKKDADILSMSPEIKQESHVLHGDIPQQKRERVLQQFREGSIKVLITTNVAARGLDIPEVDLVVQCNPPMDIDSYIHRAGRTGRAGKSGVCVLLYTQRAAHEVQRVERVAKIQFTRAPVPNANDIIQHSIKDILRSLDSVTDRIIERFTSEAEKLVEERGAVQAVAATLALLAGQTDIKPQSLITAEEGLTTFLYTGATVISYKSYIFNMLGKKYGETIKEKIRNLKFTADHMGAAFDVPLELVEQIEKGWKSTGECSLIKCIELPALELPKSASNGGGYGEDGGGNWGQRSKEQRNRQRGTWPGAKRGNPSSNGDGHQNKRIKFE